MTAYFTELGFCFQPRPTEFTLENNACLSFDQASESMILSAWTDGTWWMDFDGALVGWIEIDGVTFFPPLEAYPVAGLIPPVMPPITPEPPPVQMLGTLVITTGMSMLLMGADPTPPVGDVMTFLGEAMTWNGEAMTYG